MELQDAQGNKIDTKGLDDNLVKVLTAAFGGITPQLKSSMDESIKPLSEKLEALDTDKLSEVIEKVGKLGEQGKAGDENDTTPTSSDPAVQAILTRLDEIAKKQEEFESSTAQQREASAAMERTVAYIEKHNPNLKGKKDIITRIASTNPKDDAGVKAALDSERQYMSSAMGEDAVSKLFSADAQSEGGQTGDEDNAEAEAKAKIEKMDAQLPKS
tara:strand:+ start:36781 stop:37425 length:645 start_codon:yes stop_codon:yes gene_type:complete